MILALVCPAVIIVNISGEPWKEVDQKSLNSAKGRCSVHYPEAPCLKKFIKKEPLVYNAICGEPEKKDKYL